MNKTLKIMGQLAIVATLCVAGSAFAQDIATTATDKLGSVFRNVRQIVFILGGFALVGFAVAAIFGKLEWKKVAILAVGLAILAVASQVVQYAVGSDSKTGDIDYTDAIEDFNS